MRLAAGSRFRLAGMHIRTRELDHWLNITLWWSPTPDTDFGADRPAAVRSLGGPWSSYKMCVATDYDEHDPDPTGGFSQSAPSLGAALRAVHERDGTVPEPPVDQGIPGAGADDAQIEVLHALHCSTDPEHFGLGPPLLPDADLPTDGDLAPRP